MNEQSTRKIYEVWSNFYDLLWHRIVDRRSRKAIDRMGLQPGETLLDIGVGTGLALGNYPEHTKVTGIDLSEGMLAQAKERTDSDQMGHISLALADALELPFADNSFDHALMSHVVTVVSDPVRVLEETSRVVKPGGRIVIINHFRSERKLWGKVEEWICPICERIGWKSDLDLHWLLEQSGFEMEFRYKLAPVDLFQTVFLVNRRKSESRKQEAA
jgi:phosphatidylethanolamine/phosphatidyl-N-methylethanolamine N-methyltransferase